MIKRSISMHKTLTSFFIVIFSVVNQNAMFGKKKPAQQPSSSNAKTPAEKSAEAHREKAEQRKDQAIEKSEEVKKDIENLTADAKKMLSEGKEYLNEKFEEAQNKVEQKLDSSVPTNMEEKKLEEMGKFFLEAIRTKKYITDPNMRFLKDSFQQLEITAETLVNIKNRKKEFLKENKLNIKELNKKITNVLDFEKNNAYVNILATLSSIFSHNVNLEPNMDAEMPNNVQEKKLEEMGKVLLEITRTRKYTTDPSMSFFKDSFKELETLSETLMNINNMKEEFSKESKENIKELNTKIANVLDFEQHNTYIKMLLTFLSLFSYTLALDPNTDAAMEKKIEKIQKNITKFALLARN